ncbi:MAG: hypothetical protein EXR69_09335 [Myxococcales bacterium]|nr:hypothetical protein [Myxococcales bacterium]
MRSSYFLRSSSVVSSGFLMLLCALSGCTWITDNEKEDRLALMDDDGDGFPAAEDCNEADASVNPAAEEIWYDGVDQDCVGDDDYDADKDGYVPDAYLGLATGAVDGSGTLPGGDCDDAGPTVSPGGVEVFYDGVDQDCTGDDDYDQDKDRFVRIGDQGKPTAGVAGSGALPAGDCDDEASGVHPGGADPWYDGVDSDCVGNDDYDQDVDGFYFSDDAVAYGPTAYVDGSGVLPGGDCSDTDPTYFPGAPDDWYDGYDKNCDLVSDWDQDGDGFDVVHGSEGDDCDDLQSLVHPGGDELLNDANDSDCDGEDDRFALLALDGVIWTDAREPLFAANADSVYLSVPDTQLTYDGQDYYDSAAAIRWTLANPLVMAGIQMWNSNTSNPASFDVGDGQGFVVDAEYIFGVLALDLTSGHGLRFIRFNLSTGSRDGVNVQSSGTPAYVDVSFAYNGTSLLAAGADVDGNLTFARVDDVTSSNYDVNHEESQGVDRVALTLSGDIPIYGSAGADLYGFDFDSLGSEDSFTPVGLASGFAAADLDMTDDLGLPYLVEALPLDGLIRLLDLGTGLATDISASQVENVAVAFSADTATWYIAWADGAGDVHLSFGADLSALQTLDWDLPGTSAQVAAWSAGGVVWMAVVADGVLTVGQVQEE